MLKGPICFLDMDGVIADLVNATLDVLQVPDPYRLPHNRGRYELHDIIDISWEAPIWNHLDRAFWAGIPPMPDMPAILDAIGRTFGLKRTYICTSPPDSNPESVLGKADWVQQHLPDLSTPPLYIAAKWLLARPSRVLIDDKDQNIDEFIAAGGIGVLVPRPWNRLHAHPKVTADYLHRAIPEAYGRAVRTLAERPSDAEIEEFLAGLPSGITPVAKDRLAGILKKLSPDDHAMLLGLIMQQRTLTPSPPA